MGEMVCCSIYLFLAKVFERALNTEVPNPCSWSELNANWNNPLVFLSFSLPVWMLGCSGTQLCLTLCDPMNCRPCGSSVLGISQARILEWVAVSSSREPQCTHLKKRIRLVFTFFFESACQISYYWLLCFIFEIYIYIYFFFPQRHYWVTESLFWEKETFLFNGTLSTFNGVILPHTHMPLKASLNRAVNPGTSQSFSSSFNPYG